jgi:hypothetical protein
MSKKYAGLLKTEKAIVLQLNAVAETIEEMPDKDRGDDMHTIHMHCTDAMGAMMDRRNMEHIDDLLEWAGYFPFGFSMKYKKEVGR